MLFEIGRPRWRLDDRAVPPAFEFQPSKGRRHRAETGLDAFEIGSYLDRRFETRR